MGYEGPIYGETVTVGTTAQDIAGDAATGLKAVTAAPDPNNEKSQEVLANFRERYQYITLPWHLGSAYDDVYITAECLRQTSGGYVNRCVNDIRRRPSQPLIQWRFHPHTVHRDRRLRSTQGPSDA